MNIVQQFGTKSSFSSNQIRIQPSGCNRQKCLAANSVQPKLVDRCRTFLLYLLKNTPNYFKSYSQQSILPIKVCVNTSTVQISNAQQRVEVVGTKSFGDRNLGYSLDQRKITSIYDKVDSQQFTKYNNNLNITNQRSPPSPYVMNSLQQALGQLYLSRVLRLGGAVMDDMANTIVAQMLILDNNDPGKDITLYINSPGGSVTAGMALFDTMRYVKSDIRTVCAGLAASMGAFLLGAGQKGKRCSLPNSRIMIHQPLGGAQGAANDIEVQANELLYFKYILNGLLAEFSGRPIEQVFKDTDRDNFMTPEETVNYGLIDFVLSRPLET